MRTHRLDEIAIAGREMVLSRHPAFDFYDLGRVVDFRINFGSETTTPSVVLKLEYPDEAATHVLTLRMQGFRQLVLAEIQPVLFLRELEIADVRGSQLEGISYEVVSHLRRAFSCSCAEVVIEAFEPISGAS